MVNRNPQKKSIDIHFPLGLLGFEGIRAAGLSEQQKFCMHNIPIFNLHSEDGALNINVLQTDFSYYSTDIRYFIRHSIPANENDSTIFIPLYTQKTLSGVRIMGNLRCPLVLNNRTLCAHQIILNATDLTMNGHLFTIHGTNIPGCGLYDG